MTHGALDIMRLRQSLNTRRIGRRIDQFDELPSTNAHLLGQADDADFDGAVIVAEYQSVGRGRQGRHWHCPRGAGILCTVGLLDDDRSIDAGLLALVVPVALCAGIRRATDLRCEIEWPNDIMHRSKKLAGILIEAHARGPSIRYAIGFGINCLQHARHFPRAIRDRATSLDLASDQPIDRTAVLAALLGELDAHLVAPRDWDAGDIRAAWRQRAIGLGRRVRITHDGQRVTGHLVDIDPTSAIVVQLDEGGRRLFSAANSAVEWLD